MTHNYPPGPPWPYPHVAPPPRRRPGDVIAATLLAVLLLLTCGLGLIYSMFAGMATDVCSSNHPCHDGLINGAYLVAWGGIGAAVLLTLAGMGVSVRRRSRMVVWPAVGWLIFVVTFVAGGLLLSAGVGGLG
ncbi:hypothetical protein [Mycobacterium sp. P7213]|uniref:hypothetical protein n=1 Tax=Mycobacterium sp. P7213 TaxID=2478465 RepID=UPI000F63D4F7|nr:hypothetical protein [Mycobacterium sp. P7213]